MVIGAYAVALVVVSGVVYNVRSRDRARSLAHTALIVLGFAFFFALLFISGRAVGRRFSGEGHEHGVAPAGEARDNHEHEDAHVVAGELSPEQLSEVIAHTRDATTLAQLFDEVADPGQRVEIVRRALVVDAAEGVGLALRFLEADPPLFFAHLVVDELNAHLRMPAGYDVGQPFSSPANQEAVERIRAETAYLREGEGNP
jgi:hypothetical protein